MFFTTEKAIAVLAYVGVAAADLAPISASKVGKTAHLVGCYIDALFENRILPDKIDGFGRSATACVEEAIFRGYAFAAAENGNECWAGAEMHPWAVQAADWGCETPCEDGSGETCGGAWRAQIYTTNPPPPDAPLPKSLGNGADLVGCFGDTADDHLLTVYLGNVNNNAECVAAAQQAGHADPVTGYMYTYSFAGTQQGKECWVGSPGPGDFNSETHAQVASSFCAQPCAGADQETCGGDGAIQVYKVPATVSAKRRLGRRDQH